MSSYKRDRLYNLLPAFYRMADDKHKRPLQALLRVIEEEMNALERDIAGLYDDWFIETCSDWVIPYIGDLLGIKGMQYITSGWNLRSYVANSLAYRRRKGTATVLEKVARDVTGWPAHSLEFFRLTAATQNLNHVRPAGLQSPDLRNANHINLLDGPFCKIPHTVDVRGIDGGRGKYNISNIGIFLWRLQSYEVIGSNARRIDEGCYTFDPSGLNTPLFRQPKNDGAEKMLAEESDIPGPLRASLLRQEIRQSESSPGEHSLQSAFLISSPIYQNSPVFSEVSIKLHLEKLAMDMVSTSEVQTLSGRDLEVCDLSSWPGFEKGKIAIDPHLGRLMISRDLLNSFRQRSQKIKSVSTSYSYGFSGDIGAGPYDRTSAILEAMWEKPEWLSAVSRNFIEIKGIPVYATLSEALHEWKLYTEKIENNRADAGGLRVGLIAIIDSNTYQGDLTVIVPEGFQLLIVAAHLNPAADASDGPSCALIGEPSDQTSEGLCLLSARMLRPHLLGSINILGTAAKESENPGSLVISGLLIEGGLNVQEGNLGRLTVQNSTVIPGRGGIRVYSREEKMNDGLKLTILQSICGKIELAKSIPELIISECIIDAKDQVELAINAIGAQAKITESTIIGKSCLSSLCGNDCIFTGQVSVRQKQAGYIRFSYLPFFSITPRRLHCQPETFLEEESDKIIQSDGNGYEDLASKFPKFLNRIHPAFTSLSYPDPGYAQLSESCPREIKAGAEDGSEMGVFKSLHQPQRIANLKAALLEYLPIELEAGIFFVT